MTAPPQNMLPPEDRVLSPYTGWTRAHWEAVTDRTLAEVRPFASPRHALIALPGPQSMYGRRSDGLEGFARTFLAAGFRLAHDGGATEGGGALAEWYAEGLAAGTDPSSPECWPKVGEVAQAKVEAASIALALHESRRVLWDALDEGVRARVVAWLADVIGSPYPACNWLWFQNVVEAFLRSVGGPWSAEDVDANIATMETWYLGDGWYTDGLEGAANGVTADGGTARNFDWYAGWAMNFYPLWYCRISGEHADPALRTRYAERLHAYLHAAQHLYAPDGAPLHQGRSLTYRHATLAPVWAGAVFDATPLPPGRTRRLASAVLRHFDAPGPQTIGWRGEFPLIRQPYTGPGSPYWSSKGLAGLVLPPDHPVWTATEEPLEVEERDVSFGLRVPGWLVSATRDDGVVRVVNHGTDHTADAVLSMDDPGYSRHAYATHAGPEYDGSMLDGHVALVDADGRPSHRRPLRPGGVRGRTAFSRHRAHWPLGENPGFEWPLRQPEFRVGPWVTTASVLRGSVEIRLVRVDGPDRVDGPAPDTHGPWTLRVGGYALADRTPLAASADGGTAMAIRMDGLTSTIVGLRGLRRARVEQRHAANAFGRHSAVPVVEGDGPVRPGEVYAAAVILSGAGDPRLPWVAVDPAGRVEVRWQDGEVDRVTLPVDGRSVA